MQLRVTVMVFLSAVACADSSTILGAPDPVSIDALREQASTRFEAIERAGRPSDALAKARFDLGRALFFERRLSLDGSTACASCHQEGHGGADGMTRAVGALGQKTPRNAPSIYNVSVLMLWHWRADRASLEDAAYQSFSNPILFGEQTEQELVERARRAGYEPQFVAASLPLTLQNGALAIAEFERTLLTPSAFDAFLLGDDAALDPEQRAGLATFLRIGCADCHDAAALGGDRTSKFGVFSPYAAATGSSLPDAGRQDVTLQSQDQFVFRIAPLRNVADSAPYFHDGSVAELPKAVRVMAKVQLGLTLTDHQTEEIVAFLGALSGEPPSWFSPE